MRPERPRAADLAVYRAALHMAQDLDRLAIRYTAAEAFDTERIVATTLNHLDLSRTVLRDATS